MTKDDKLGERTSRRCLTRLTKLLPSAANPLTARMALLVLESRRTSSRSWCDDRSVDKRKEQGEEKGLFSIRDVHAGTLPLTEVEFEGKRGDSQGKHLALVSTLNRVTLGLTGVSSDDGKVFPGDGQDGTSVRGVRVEPAVRAD